MLMGFQGKCRVRYKIEVNDKAIENFEDLITWAATCHYSCNEDPIQKLYRFQRLCGTLQIMLKGSIKKQILFYEVTGATWSLTLREIHRLRVFENRVLRRIFELQRCCHHFLSDPCTFTVHFPTLARYLFLIHLVSFSITQSA
jgi:hypothetical protein